MKVPPIETEEEYENALIRLEALLDAQEGSHEASEREALLEAIEDYEDEIYPITALPKKD